MRIASLLIATFGVLLLVISRRLGIRTSSKTDYLLDKVRSGSTDVGTMLASIQSFKSDYDERKSRQRIPRILGFAGLVIGLGTGVATFVLGQHALGFLVWADSFYIAHTILALGNILIFRLFRDQSDRDDFWSWFGVSFLTTFVPILGGRFICAAMGLPYAFFLPLPQLALIMAHDIFQITDWDNEVRFGAVSGDLTGYGVAVAGILLLGQLHY